MIFHSSLLSDSVIHPDLQLTALRIPAALAHQAAFLVYQAVGVAAFGTGAGNGMGAVGDEFFQSSFHSVLPGVDGIDFEMEFGDNIDNKRQRHPVPQDSGNKFGIIPVFLVE